MQETNAGIPRFVSQRVLRLSRDHVMIFLRFKNFSCAKVYTRWIINHFKYGLLCAKYHIRKINDQDWRKWLLSAFM